MKRYRFRLEAVLRLRRMEEEQARDALALANRRLAALLAAREAEEARYGTLRAVAPETTPEGLRLEHQRAEIAAARVSAAKRAVVQGASEAAMAQLIWSAAQRKVRVLERLDERRRAEHAADELRASVVETDDIVTARYVQAASSARDRHLT